MALRIAFALPRCREGQSSWALVAILVASLLVSSHIGYQWFPTLQTASLVLKSPAAASKIEQWPDLELLIPLPPTDEALEEYASRLHASLEFFWPKQHLNLLFLTDGEVDNINSFQSKLLTMANSIANKARVELNHPLFERGGHNRQQWLMMWADNFTQSELIGFLDTDTVFSTRVALDDLYDEDGKPRANVVYGQPYNYWWEKVPRSTFGATGLKEKFKAMTYFPVIVKRHHLSLIRQVICDHMDIPLFDDAFQEILNRYGIYSQFNLMMNTLYFLRHDEYRWHISERLVGWTGPVPEGQIESIDAAAFPAADLIPYPRIAIHWTYESFGKLTEPAASEKFKEVMRSGYCYSIRPATMPDACQGIDFAGTVNPFEWVFEGDVYADRPDVLKVHVQHRLAHDNLPEHPWDPTLVTKWVTSSW